MSLVEGLSTKVGINHKRLILRSVPTCDNSSMLRTNNEMAGLKYLLNESTLYNSKVPPSAPTVGPSWQLNMKVQGEEGKPFKTIFFVN